MVGVEDRRRWAVRRARQGLFVKRCNAVMETKRFIYHEEDAMLVG
jgi:hypothetical protein